MGKDDAARLLAAADFFQIAGIAFDFPGKDLAEGLSDGSLADDVLSCLVEMGASEDEVAPSLSRLRAACTGTSDEELLASLRREHSRLFANTRQPVVWAYETMFCHVDDGRSEKPSLFVSPACLHVEQSMRQAGVKVSQGNKQPADYLPTELQFLSYLCNAAAHELDGEKERGQAVDRLFDFKCRHTDRWIVPFMEEVASKTKLTEYRELAILAAEGYRRLGGMA